LYKKGEVMIKYELVIKLDNGYKILNVSTLNEAIDKFINSSNCVRIYLSNEYNIYDFERNIHPDELVKEINMFKNMDVSKYEELRVASLLICNSLKEDYINKLNKI